MATAQQWMRDLALRGARYALIEMERERGALLRKFPELREEVEQAEPAEDKKPVRRHHKPVFRRRIVAKAKRDGVAVTAKKHGLSKSVIHAWIKKDGAK